MGFGQYPRVGYSNIIGYDNIIGASPQNWMPPNQNSAYAQEAQRRALRGAGVALALNGQGSGPQVVQDSGGPLRDFPLGFFQAAVGKSTQATIKESPQVIFRGARLVMASTIEATPVPNPFRLVDLKVGQRSQFVSATRVPAVVFSEQGVGVALSLDTCSTGQDVSVVVINTDAAATHDFEAALIGTCQLPG
jgi:hypothetical protein